VKPRWSRGHGGMDLNGVARRSAVDQIFRSVNVWSSEKGNALKKN